ncbi:hypothetical protein GCM10011289_16720 [Paludibacterium paludis]|uniref:Glycosyltransferase 2-like domain-containing protein n=2 Tax=Paludibacterium paludis TaxID=1225769 RepID=A0A918U9J3_9NEIS|nr:hypothetical protein GCM10011289_16720 [Paludibacterium paludis]
MAKYRFILLTDSERSFPPGVECLRPSEIDRLLAANRSLIVQSLSREDHQFAAKRFLRNRNGHYLLATHLDGKGIPGGILRHIVYNKLTDINLFIDQNARAPSGAPGFLGLKNPMVLDQPQLGDRADLRMLHHAYEALLHPSRTDVSGLRKQDDSDICLAYVTHFYCNQQDISSVTNLLARYAAYPSEVISRVHFVVVDDGSPIEYDIPDLALNLTWLKIDQDIRWNQAGARNLGAVYAKSDTMLLTDLDHELPVDAMRRLIARPPCGKRIYKIYRKKPDGSVYSGHSNMFLVSRGRFFECHGYDEEFAGHYGAEDFRFIKYHKARGTLQRYLPKSILCIEREDINRRKSYHSLARDLSFNTPVDSRKKRELAVNGHGHGHSRMFLNFTWRILLDRRLPVTSRRTRHTIWKHLAIFRQILPRF